MEEFGLADVAIVGGDNVSDYPYGNKSCGSGVDMLYWVRGE